jgi:hypothetical protein
LIYLKIQSEVDRNRFLACGKYFFSDHFGAGNAAETAGMAPAPMKTGRGRSLPNRQSKLRRAVAAMPIKLTFSETTKGGASGYRTRLD